MFHSLENEDILLSLKDTEPGVREQSARLAEGHLAPGSSLVDSLLALARDADPMVRFQAALSLGDLPQGDVRGIDALATIAIRDASDRWTRTAVLSSIAGRAPKLAARVVDLQPEFFSGREGQPWLDDLAVMVGTENDPASIRELLASFRTPSSLRRVVFGLGTGLKRAGGSPGAVLRGTLGTSLDPLFKKATDDLASDAAPAVRIEAIRLLGLGSSDEVLATLPDRLDSREPTEVQLAALQALKDLADPRVGPAIVDHWKGLSPSIRREAVEALFARGDRVEALLEGVKARTITVADLDQARRTQLLNHSSAKVKELARSLFGENARANRKAVLEAFRPALALTGEKSKGKEIFTRVCATCHKAEGQGYDVGPSLETVAARTPEDLLVHILDPNREVAANYVGYVVETIDGQTFSGLIAEESANALTLKRASAATDVVPRKRIEAIASTGLTLMPEGLEAGLQPKDLADLIAYIRGLQGAPLAPSR